MDSLRFGRALGIGARSAAKALAAAVKAATAEDPISLSSRDSEAKRSARTTVRTTVQVSAHTAGQARTARQGFLRGGKRFGEAVWGPVARLSGVLWLEITGAFFGIFAAFAGQAAWTHRGELAGPTALHWEARIHAAVFVGMAAVFGYFCISSFVRARRRERQR